MFSEALARELETVGNGAVDGVDEHHTNLFNGMFTLVTIERMFGVVSQSSKFHHVGVTPATCSDAAAGMTDVQEVMAMI